ncbi:MSCRAMM family protein [Holdemanella sp.]|uniref:MSCRAMM family protein n=1 Tax=Holdemanella sp. TaxID=1971762 RepID=UPI002E76FEBD|nr:SpaA isopeptide-forming pilin-related protein [Holdemanella sp.]MEE0467168.1 SpaA isopeptide-forming pilin-related protein [Holdemanella sp.]
MKKFKNVFLAFFVTALTSLNLVLPAYAEETTTPTVDSAGFSVNVVGDGTVTLSSGDFTKSLSNGDIFNADYEEGTEIKIVSKSNENAVIDDVTLNSSTISGFTTGKKSFSFVYTTKTADANFSVTFKTKETQKTESSTSDKTTSEQSSVQNEDSNTSEDASSNDEVTESEDAEKYGTFDVDLSKMDIDTSKTVYTKYLYAIPSAVSENDTITSALIDKDPKDTIYTQTMEPSTVYTDGDAYYIQADTPFVNGLAKKSYPYDYDVARGNDYGQQLTEGFSYDKKTHILKIDKDVFKTVAKEAKTDNNPKEDFSDLQVQFLVPADVENDVKVKTTVVDKTGSIDSVVGDSISLRPFMTTRFQLASEKTASNIIPKNVKVYVNGSDVPLESEYGAYDPETGEMALSYMGANLKSLEIVISKSKGRAVGVGLGTAKVGSINVLAYLAEGTKDVFSVGSSIDVVGKFGNNSYVQTIDGPLELYNKSRTTAGGYFNTVDWNDGDGGECTYTDSALAVPQSITMNGQTVDFTMRDINGNSYGQWVNGGNGLTDISDPVAFNGAIQAFCHHIKQAVGTINENSRYDLRYPTCTLRVLDASTINGYRHVVFGFETNLHHFSGSTPQTVGTVFELAFKVQSKGKLCIKKTSANPAITDNNPCYSLQGAEYGVYKTEADAKANKNKVNTLTIGKYDSSEKYKDWSNEIELDAGTYYLKETKNPKGYALNNSVVSVVVKANESSWIGSNGEFKDYPQSDPIGILLGKIDKETNKNKPQGSASLANAEFTVKYYKGLYDSDPAKSGQTPARTWVLKTNSDGYCFLDNNYKVSGDDFYYNSNNTPTVPVGTVTIQETKAPSGYFINSEVFVRKITPSGSDANVSTYNYPEVNEKVIKFNIKKVQAGTSTPVSGAVFRHTLPNGSTEDLETNGSGEITITGLASGTHKIKEIKSPDGYQLNPNEVVFNVASGTGKITFTSGTNSLVTHGTKDSGDGYATFADKVNPFNLKITKTNEHGKVLKGAEFRLYSDADCKNVVDTQISDEKGLLTFKNLDVEKTYYFKETKAPQGYRIPVDENGKAYVHSVYVKATPQTNTFEFTVDGIKYDTSKTSGNVHLEGTKKDRVVAVDITNKTTQLLPETGSNGTILLIGLGVAVIAFALYKSKKDKMISK